MQKAKVAAIPASAIIDLSAATGPVAVKMTNDYLFRALLQRNNRVLKGLIRSLLHLSPEEITSVEVTNPIELGKPFYLLPMPHLLQSESWRRL